MFIPATKYILNGFALYITNSKEPTSLNIRIKYTDINPTLEWLKCNEEKLIYDEDITITNRDPKIVTINYNIVKGFYNIDVSYKNGIYIIDNKSITIGLTKGETNLHINFPQSAYKLI